MLGDSLMRLGQTDAALAAYRKAVAVAPTNRDGRIRLAGLLAYRGENPEARDLYQALITEGVHDPLAYPGSIEVSAYAATEAEPVNIRPQLASQEPLAATRIAANAALFRRKVRPSAETPGTPNSRTMSAARSTTLIALI